MAMIKIMLCADYFDEETLFITKYGDQPKYCMKSREIELTEEEIARIDAAFKEYEEVQKFLKAKQ
jgi:hypothetical protein